jgi:hypothetical protein
MTTGFAPLKTLTSTSHKLTLYPDRLVIQRTDWLSKLFGEFSVILVKDIREVRLYTSRFMTSNWLQFVIFVAQGRPIPLKYHCTQEREVREFKEAIGDLLSRRELLPLPVV